MSAEAITVLRARGRRLAKLVHPDGRIDDFDQVRTVDLFAQPLADLEALEHLLRRLARRPDCAVVRGAIAEPWRARGVRRLLHPDRQTGDRPTLVDRPRRWVAIDIDNLDRPPGLAATDLTGCGAAAIATLPGAFQHARSIVQATASHGLKPGVRLRLWFWASRPLSGVEAKTWLRAAPVDRAVFGAAQLIYTASPIFACGAADPLAERIVVLPRPSELVSVPSPAELRPPPPRRRPPLAPSGPAPLPDHVRGNRYAFAALTGAATRIARAAEGTRHPQLVSEACGLARLIGGRLLTESDVKSTLAAAARLAGIGGPGRDAEAEAEAVLAWALAHSTD